MTKNKVIDNFRNRNRSSTKFCRSCTSTSVRIMQC